MLTKILFTIVVIIGVAIFYRQKAAMAGAARAKSTVTDTDSEDALPVRRLAYILIGILIAIAVLVFAYNWHQNNRIVNIRVTGQDGEVTTYQARHSDIKGRSFSTLTGVEVTLGESDRVEMLQE